MQVYGRLSFFPGCDIYSHRYYKIVFCQTTTIIWKGSFILMLPHLFILSFLYLFLQFLISSSSHSFLPQVPLPIFPFFISFLLHLSLFTALSFYISPSFFSLAFLSSLSLSSLSLSLSSLSLLISFLLS